MTMNVNTTALLSESAESNLLDPVVPLCTRGAGGERMRSWWVLAPHGVVNQTNKAALEAAESSGAAVDGKVLWECSWWNYSEAVQKALQSLVARARGGESCRETLAMRVSGGRTLSCEVTLTPMSDSTGTVTHLLASAEEWSERTWTDEALRESEERFRLIAESSPLGIFRTDAQGRHTYTNRQMSQITGRSADELQGESWLKPIHPAERVAVWESWLSASGQGASWTHQHRLITHNGEMRWVTVWTAPVLGAGGELHGHVGNLMDVTGRKLAEEALRQSDERLRAHVENSPLAILEWDNHFTVTRWAGAAEKIFGFAAREIIGRPFASLGLVHKEDWPQLQASIAGLSNGVTRQASATCRNLTKSGELIDCEWYTTVLLDASGAIASVMLRVMDVTARKRAAEKIRELNAELEQRVQRRTQELREVVCALETEMTERKRLEREILEISEREQCRLGQDLHDGLSQQLAGIALLGKVLANRLQAEAHSAAKTAGDIAALTAETISSARSLAKGLYPVELSRYGLLMAVEDLANQTTQRFQIQCQLSKSGPVPRFENFTEIHLYRIVQESIGNAIKHGQARHIVIESKNLNGTHIFSVTDDGVGFGDAGIGATGIGLNLMEYRARLIGAQISIEKPLGGGCRIVCRLPSFRENSQN